MRGAERVHHENVAQHRVAFGQRRIVLALAHVHAAIFEQHDFAVFDIDAAMDVVADQSHRFFQRVTQPVRNRRQRFGLLEDAFFGPSEMRHHHHLRAGVAREQNVGSAASSRCAAEILPSLSGTLRSSRISTR